MEFKAPQITEYGSGLKEITALLNGGPIVYIRLLNDHVKDSSFVKGSPPYIEFERVARKLL